jgi:hypothetical protein
MIQMAAFLLQSLKVVSLLKHVIMFARNQGNSVRIVIVYRLDGWGSIPGRGRRFSRLHSIQTNSGAHPDSYPVGTGGFFLR